MRSRSLISLSGGAALLCMTAAAASAQIQVRVNGEPVQFYGTQPRVVDGRVLVPLRGVLEQMGATVDWIASSQTVVASRNGTEIDLPIGSQTATVGGRTVTLDVPAMTIAGSTMVPLRFVSEALGADVAWSGATETVSIHTDVASAGPPRYEAYRAPRREPVRAYRGTRVVLPAGTVIPVRLDQSLSSADNSSGDTFTATVRGGDDNAGLPAGTRFEGVIREAIPRHGNRPGVLDLDVQRVVFPDGDAHAITASVYQLNGKNIVRTSDGRLEATGSQNNDRLKWVGIGAGAGLLLGTVTKGNALLDTLLGGGAGYLYNELQRKGSGDVHLGAGTEFGIRLDRQMAFNER